MDNFMKQYPKENYGNSNIQVTSVALQDKFKITI